MRTVSYTLRTSHSFLIVGLSMFDVQDANDEQILRREHIR